MNNDNKPRLWLIDDERNEPYLGVMRPNIESKGVELEVRAGGGMLQDFMFTYPSMKDTQRDCFLLDVFMGVPQLLSSAKYWRDHPVTYKGTGFALANWLHHEQGIALDRIRAVSVHTNYSLIKDSFGLSNLYCYEDWHSVLWKELSIWAKSGRRSSGASQ